MKHTPWKLIWHDNANYPFPLSVHTEDDSMWITRDGTVSSIAAAKLIAASSDLLEALKYARRFLNAEDHDTAFVDAAIEKATS